MKEKKLLNSTIFENNKYWFRKHPATWGLKLFIRGSNKLTKHLRRIIIRIPFYEFGYMTDPFENQQIIWLGTRFFDYYWFHFVNFKSIKSKS